MYKKIQIMQSLAETQYVATNPNLKLDSDPQYELLDTQEGTGSRQHTQSIQDIINTIQQSIFNTQGTGANTLFQVIDSPQIPDRPASRTKNYLTYGGIGSRILSSSLRNLSRHRRATGSWTIYSSYDLQGLVTLPVSCSCQTDYYNLSLLTTYTMHGRPCSQMRKIAPMVILIESEKDQCLKKVSS